MANIYRMDGYKLNRAKIIARDKTLESLQDLLLDAEFVGDSKLVSFLEATIDEMIKKLGAKE